MNKVTLVSNDQQEFQVEKDIVLQSILVKNMLEDIDQEDTPVIPLPNIKGTTLKKVLEYCEHHRYDEPLSEDDDKFDVKRINNIVSEWDKTFINSIDSIEGEELFEIILAANYLDIRSLLDLGCKTVADKLKGKSPQEIRDLFGIENDLETENAEEAV